MPKIIIRENDTTSAGIGLYTKRSTGATLAGIIGLRHCGSLIINNLGEHFVNIYQGP